MKKSISISSVTIILLLVAIVAMSVGFAVFSSTLNIEGSASVESSNWNIAFDEDSYQETSGSVVASDKTINATSMTYSLTLTEPGDFYEFTINVENTGTFNANLTGLTLSSFLTEQAKYLKYSVSYNGSEYTSTQDSLSVALNSGSNAPVKVRVEYVQPDNPADLPKSTQQITLNASLDFEQAM